MRGGFPELDEDFVRFWSGDQEEIDECAIGARTSCRINGAKRELFAQNRGGTVNVLAAQLDLLNSFAEFLQIPGDGAGALWLAAGQNIERNATWKMKFKFLGILIGGHVSQARQSAGFADFLEAFLRHGQADRHKRMTAIEQCGELLIRPPRKNGVIGEGAADAVDFIGSRDARLGI